jgi:hypothetical protein
MPSLVRSTTEPSGTASNVTERVPAQRGETDTPVATITTRQNFMGYHSCTPPFQRQAALWQFRMSVNGSRRGASDGSVVVDWLFVC